MPDDPAVPTLRAFTPNDLPALLALWHATGVGGPERGDDGAVIARTLEYGGRVLVLEAPATGAVVGSAWLTHDGRRLYLHHVAVDPVWRRRGLGERLVRAALDLAAQTGMQIKLEVHRDNDAARRLYARLGFRQLDGLELHIVRDPRALAAER